MAKSQLSGTVFDIKKFSIHDGPGIRTTVFLKGCPLNCVWCHNPEGISADPEIQTWENRCIACGDCAAECPNHAITFVDGKRMWETQLCEHCGACALVCQAEAVQHIGKRMIVAEVLAEIGKDTVYYDQSGGGVTFSGGEPLNQVDFLAALLEECQKAGIHTAVDTCGFSATRNFEKITPLTDLFLFDLKIIDPERHRRFTGLTNGLILDNLRALDLAAREVVIRIPIIPGINDDPENISGIGTLLDSLENIRCVNLLPYHNTASEKYLRRGSEYPLGDVQPPSNVEMASIADRLSSYGLSVTIGG